VNMITIVLLEKLAGRSKSAHHDASSPEIITCVLERLIIQSDVEIKRRDATMRTYVSQSKLDSQQTHVSTFVITNATQGAW